MELQDAKGLSGYIASGAGVLGPSSVAMENYLVQLGNTHVGFSIVFLILWRVQQFGEDSKAIQGPNMGVS